MSNRMRVLVNDTLITVNARHLIITRNMLSQKSRGAIIYKSCLQASFKIDVRLKKQTTFFPFYLFLITLTALQTILGRGDRVITSQLSFSFDRKVAINIF